ncbi:MAG: dihydrofolate reductase, partial [Bacteroidota bacterium]
MPTPSTEQVVLDTFADLQILYYELPGWDKLSLQQKTFIYHLSEAALAGRDIIYDQHCKYNIAVRKTIEAIHKSWKGDRSTREWNAFVVYSKRVWFSNGIHHHYNEGKIIPGFSQLYFADLVRGSSASMLPMPTEELLKVLTPVIFDPGVMAKRTNKEAGVDVVVNSAVNFYEGVTADEVDDYYSKLIDQAGPNAPMFGLNSKLV